MNDATIADFERPPLAIRIEGEPGQLYGALARAQVGFRPLVKNRTVQVRSDKGHYSFDYATLDAVLDSVRESLGANGLCITQPWSRNGDSGTIETRLGHESGAVLIACVTFSSPGKIQEFGSLLTYMRRYAVSSLLGISSEEDDDGNAADGNQATGKDRGKPPPAPQQATKGSGGGKATQGKPAGKAAPQAGQEGQRRPEPSSESAPAGGLAQRAPVDVGTAVAGAMAAAEKARVDHPDPDSVRKSEPPPPSDTEVPPPGDPEILISDQTFDAIIAVGREIWPNQADRKENLAALCMQITGIDAKEFKDIGTEAMGLEFLARLEKMRAAEAG